MSAYKFMSEDWRRRDISGLAEELQKRAIEWRRQPSIARIPRPTRLDRARRIGYKAKQGFVVIRVRVRKGGARKSRPRSGRRPKAMGMRTFSRAKSLKKIAEERAARKFPNLKVLNSYYVWEDGTSKWFETVMVDPNHPAIRGTAI
jgi:large subunit ribosomal protein L15e